ncbi:hypothetical protein CGC48_02015 [Capnocytophaga cynodegmi]|uniref:Uncharacterized protein n=1 Tax=Capnocytophaga cynodegmi TaxID=28189 RepID=A0A250E704_9FLAO|nr:hypothetical protein [Capnocytophaga cynodegmi]ATA67506.1 hypothetical protein CGC48_02015 [Capnocytophaga cynodegmi]
MIKSKFKRDVLFYISGMIFVIFVFTLFFRKILNKDIINIEHVYILLFIISLYILCLNFLKYIRIIKLDKKFLTYYSLLCPFGKTIFLDEYIGKITIQETGSSGSYEVVYLVNKQNKTAFKIMGLHYKNFDEMKKAIALPEIKKHLSAKEYFQLLFTGVLDLSKVQNKKSSEFSINKFLGIFITIALIVFLIGMLIKVFTKFMS